MEIIEAIFSWILKINIQASVVGLGASFIAYKYNSVQNSKKQQSQLIQKIQRLATEHWCSSGSDTNNHFRAIEIQQTLQMLSWKIDQSDEKIKQSFIDLRQAVTRDNFAETDRNPILFDDPHIELINRLTKDLRKNLKLKKEH